MVPRHIAKWQELMQRQAFNTTDLGYSCRSQAWCYP